ncbi:ImmA/IrrE family metallo-endopeptidase [Arthrobacter sp. ISL-48]|uniref:helix-turn-helix domain-containing protein n=1 Tax=Arthrobacter sp. ISL-48 TaxID=2819110 RepID=UPI001BE71171|nr:XRE family transcriptional regulator [Arthrobacter sp. ISL-48]MBT2533946.1 ImmA/IrrE family metallo-endopeptidase [Arthrobacter sp. ISL-48]
MKAGAPRMVTLVRESKGWTQRDLSDRLEMTQGLVSKVENGLIALTGDKLEKVAAVLDCPVDLLIDEHPVRGLEVTCLHHRRKGSLMPVGVKKRVEALTHLTRVSVEGFLRGIDIATDEHLERLPIEEFEAGAEEVAQVLRARWRIPSGPITNMVALLEAVGILVVIRPLGTHAQDAVSTWPHEIGRPPIMLVNSGLSADRQRFTVAHELGHLVMHVMPGTEQEREANVFAAEFLAPAEEIRPQLEGLRPSDFPRLVELKAQWGLSVAALIQRAKDLDCITDKQFRDFRIKLSRMGWTTREPLNLPEERPQTLDSVLEVHRRDHHYSVDELAAIAKMTPQALCKYYPAASEQPKSTTLRLVK